MAILQSGVPKSGNYWLYTILKNIAKQADLEHKSFVQTHPVHEVAQTWDLSFSGQTDMDFLNIREKHCEFRISAVFQEKIVDIDDYINRCSLIWTHSAINAYALEVLPKFNKIIYIIRDPRDVAISYSKYCFTTHKLKHHPPHYEENPDCYLENRLDEMLRNWVRHVGGYLKYKNKLDIYPIFYERLLNSFDSELIGLVNYLGIELDQKNLNQIKSDVSFENMREQSPKHLRKGKSGQWRQVLTSAQKAKAEQIAGKMMDLLNYPISEAEESLPNLPTNLNQSQLKIAIAPSQKNFSDHVKHIYNFITNQRKFEAKVDLFKDWFVKKAKRLVKA